MPETMEFKLIGRITNLQGQPLTSIVVRAFDRNDPAGELPLGDPAQTDERGHYTIPFKSEYHPKERLLIIFIRVYTGERVLSESDVTRADGPEIQIDLIVDFSFDDPQDPWLRVFGMVRDAYGKTLEGVIVQAADRDLRSEQLLGRDITREGHYEIRYRRSQFRRAEKDSADLVLRVVDTAGAELYKTPVQYNAPTEFEFNIVLQGGEYKGLSEFESLTEMLTPVLDGLSPLDLREDPEFQDITFLVGETGQSHQTIAVWAASFLLSANVQASEKTAGQQVDLPVIQAMKSGGEQSVYGHTVTGALQALTPAVFFGFLRQGHPSQLADTLLQGFQDRQHLVVLEERILQDLSSLTPELQQSLLEKALADNLVPGRLVVHLKEILAALQQLRLRYAAQSNIGGGKGTIGQLIALVPAAQEKQSALLAALATHSGPMDDFWKQLEKDQVLRSETVREIKLTFELGALTRNHVPLVAELKSRFQQGDLKAKRELARNDRAAWIELLRQPGPDGKPVGVPANIDGDSEDARYEQFAVILEERFQREYPTTAFAANMQRSEASPVVNRSDVLRFLDNNPSFHLDRYRVDHYLAENKEALRDLRDSQAMVTDLKSIQRIFKLNSTFAVVDTLIQRKIDSAQQIYFMGRSQFVTMMKEANFSILDAKKMFARAENTYAMALTLFGTYNIAINGVSPFGVPSLTPDPKTHAKISALPNLQTLFGSLDYCECSHCRSVYSPAAYFVDILRFLGERATNGTGVNAGKSVRDVLLERRPDLGEIELNCENTETPLPYIDLVNEILEDVIAPPTPLTLTSAIEAELVNGKIQQSVLDELTGKSLPVAADAQVYAPDSRGDWAIRDNQYSYKIFKTGPTLRLLPTHQTHLSAAELRANPEYTSATAYTKLRQEVFPLNLPFDLWYFQTRAYLDHLGVAQPRLFELFQQTATDGVTLSPGDLQIDNAWLGIAETERKLITGAPVGKQPWDFWGLAEIGNDLPNPEKPADTTSNITGGWIDVLSNVNVMLNRSGLTYKELLQLLDMRFVNPDGSIFIFDTADTNTANCDTSTFTIRNLSEEALSRIQRFIRLWHRLGCSMWELDLLLPDTNPDPNIIDKQLTDTVLQDISQMKRLRDQLDLDWRVAYSLFNDIDHNLYVDRSKDGAPVVQTLYQRLFRNKLVDAVASFPPSPDLVSGAISARVPGILAAFRIIEADLNLILDGLGLLVTNTLDWGVLSRIYRITALARALGLSVDAFLRLQRLWGQDPFASPAAALKFVKLVQILSASSFTVFELDYLLTHHFTPNSGVALEEKTILTVLKSLREGLQKVSDDLHLKSEETPDAYVKSKLGLLITLAKDTDQRTALSIIDDTWQGLPADRDQLIDNYFTGVLDLPTAKVTLAAIPGGLSPADHQSAVDARFAFVQPALETYLLGSQQQSFLCQKVAEVLQINVPAANVLLNRLNLIGSAHTLMFMLNDPRLLFKLPDGSYQFSLDETNFTDIFKCLRLLHKDALLIDRLNMKVDELGWWLDGTHAADLSWLNARDFPLAEIDPPVTITGWVSIQEFFVWKSKLPRSDHTPFELLTNILDNTVSSSDTMKMLSTLTAWETDDLTALAKAFHWFDSAAAFDNIKQELRKSTNLVRLADCFWALRRLGVNASRAIAWTNAEPGIQIAESLKQTVKAKYDLAQWQQVIQPLQDDFREQKRQALVSWLVTHPNQNQGQNWSDSNGLYSYYLIDVEMSACMLTSRLKQAAASVQLFVQRCLLNLEVDLLAKTDLDSKWKQWKWMEYYRLWEANRKVFLYPENWIEPELRDEKSPFFKDLENDLAQNDINADTVEDAYLSYLEKLDHVANLEIRAIYNQFTSQDESVLHVFGRTRSSQAPDYYYRRRINGARWTAWEKVGLEITANLLVPALFNRRLYLFWPQLLEKAEQPTTVSTPGANQNNTHIAQPDKFWEIRLFWSELKKGKWTPKVLSDQFITLSEDDATATDLAMRLVEAPNIIVQLFNTNNANGLAPAELFDFNVIGPQINGARPADMYISESVFDNNNNGMHTVKKDTIVKTWHLLMPPNSQIQNGLIRNYNPQVYFNYQLQYLTRRKIEETQTATNFFSQSISINAPTATTAQNSLLLLRAGLPSSFTVVDSYNHSFNPASDDRFFLWDRFRTYFVDYHGALQQSYYQGALHSRFISAFRFYIHYHPFVELFIKELNIWGIKGLLNRRIQTEPSSIPGSPTLFDFNKYKPNTSLVVPPGAEVVDFDYRGAYAPYNWELFFHVPFYIANKLVANQRFEEALSWFHYIFDPTSTDTNVTNPDTPQQKFWITKPFYETTKADYYKQKIENIMLAIAKGDTELRDQVEEWRKNPFNPHLIARMRTVAYQKNVLIKYIKALIAWGDQLFGRDTIESINEATQLYILAASVLGPRPKSVPRKDDQPVMTFYQMQQAGIDPFGNVLKEVENLLPPTPAGGGIGEDSPELPHLNVLYFCIPNNENLLRLWDTVADRLFKIRHCMNIQGIVRQLPLFEPPIDPALLVKAAAAGLDISSVMNDMSAPLPLYRFPFMLQRAIELCGQVISLGNSLQAVLEKRDAEGMSLLQSTHALRMLDEVRKVKQHQVDENLRTFEALQESHKVVEEKQKHYQKLLSNGWSLLEYTAFGLSSLSTLLDVGIAAGYVLAGGLKLIPNFVIGASGFGGSPHAVVDTGGKQIGDAAENAVKTMQALAVAFDKGANLASTAASFDRRAQDWEHQKALAERELPQIDKEIAASDLRHQIAEQELRNHDLQKDNQQSEDDYMHSKFTNKELFDWMVTKLSTVYFQSYQLAYDLAKRSERCFRYELGLSDSSYVQFGYWDSLNKGLLAGENLMYDLKRLEAAYYEQSRREYELSKNISLIQLDSIALLKLRQNGECFVDIPETAFDMDYPGHYFRRIKTVALSIPCVLGPYSTLACTLTLVSNHLRKDATLLGGKYARDMVNDDPRFRDEVAAIQSIATSTAQNDSGLFELSFQDERYLPFEGAGAISTWHIRLNHEIPQFDFSTISDAILHMNYTAREGGDMLRSKAVEEFNKKLNEMALAENRNGLFRIFDLKHEFSDKWYKFLHPANPADDQALVLENLPSRLPYFTRKFNTKKVRLVEIVALASNGDTYQVMVSPLGSTPGDLLTLDTGDTTTYAGLRRVAKDLTGSEVNLDNWTLKIKVDGAADFKSLPANAIEELFLIINYTIA